MARGLKKHLKRLNAPKHWMLDKLGGAFAPKPSSGPHKERECLPLILILRNKLKYALTYREVIAILMQRHVMVDGKVRTDKTHPSGFMDVDEEGKFKLSRSAVSNFGRRAFHGHPIRYPDCLIEANDTIENTGRVGVIKNREKPKGSFESIHIQDATGHEFATCMVNVFTIGKGMKPWVSLPKGKGY
ncbi:hypothetical protein OPV22_001311 [Ensete ventricosum]|uniref:40S ribosomal protein S4 n=1 Tax=Ensete ventricosum TaxID=4639 RepID=A0AAV8RW59_ENSVE|nr:hypothetical protein OPV22_001311 [Ensete ventricosum]